MLHVTLAHKTSHKGSFFESEIYASPEIWINKLSMDESFVRTNEVLSNAYY